MTLPVLMSNPGLYQSGEIVPLSHVYELVGATDFLGKQKLHVFLKVDDRFPDHEGRAVCWRTSAAENEKFTDATQVSVNRASATDRVSLYVG